MILVPALGSFRPAWRTQPQRWIVGGCLASALALLNLSLAAASGPGWPLQASVLALGITNGIYAIAAIGAMMNMVSEGRRDREGTRMGLWGASQAISFGVGGFLGTAAIDTARHLLPSASLSYAAVFAAEAGLFVLSAYLAIWIGKPASESKATQLTGIAANQGL
jgi:BCD family chlorophyll transporter-like MFS transporter